MPSFLGFCRFLALGTKMQHESAPRDEFLSTHHNWVCMRLQWSNVHKVLNSVIVHEKCLIKITLKKFPWFSSKKKPKPFSFSFFAFSSIPSYHLFNKYLWSSQWCYSRHFCFKYWSSRVHSISWSMSTGHLFWREVNLTNIPCKQVQPSTKKILKMVNKNQTNHFSF